MVKYLEVEQTFAEVPDEISLCINITNCPCHCPDCHSKWLWEDTGTELTTDEIDTLIKNNPGISCIVFMGGDDDPNYVAELGFYIKHKYEDLKTCWYSGRDNLYEFKNKNYINAFDYIKLGRYDQTYGPLNVETTNQRMYYHKDNTESISLSDGSWENITYKFLPNKNLI